MSTTPTCPYHKVREDLPALTPRIAALPVDDRGYPIPFFVAYIDGKPDFRVMDKDKFDTCIHSKLCWVCGQPLGSYLAFVIGPMCAVTRTTSEPPSHRDCAEWSAKGCPFLTKLRREGNMPEGIAEPAGVMVARNPGVTVVWVSRKYRLFKDHKGGVLLSVGNPESVSWWKEGRPATRTEAWFSIESGLPVLKEACEREDTEVKRNAAKRDLLAQLKIIDKLLP